MTGSGKSIRRRHDAAQRPASQPEAHVLDRLFAVIESRHGADPRVSHTAQLLRDGTGAIARKVGEEAVETLIEALSGDTGKLRRESADLLYHLLVLWADAGVRPEEVWEELKDREGVSGIAEKKRRTGK